MAARIKSSVKTTPATIPSGVIANTNDSAFGKMEVLKGL
jgi:hypothetical protein